MNPKVSVIIPNYNYARYLRKRFESILNQTFQDFEIIYLDDASTDDSNYVFSHFKGDKRIREILNKKNSGNTYIQWNRGVRAAKGDYIWIAEADDLSEVGFLKKLVEALDKNPSVGITYCQSLMIDEKGDYLNSMSVYSSDKYENRWKKSFINKGKDECINYFVIKNRIPNASAVLFRKSVYEKAGFADESFFYCGDWKIWTSMLMISDIMYFEQPLNCYRVHPNSVRTKMSNTSIRIIEFYWLLFFFKNKLIIPDKILNKAYERFMYNWIDAFMNEYKKLTWKENKEIYSVAKQIDPILKLRLLKKFSFCLLRKFLRFKL